MQSKRKAIKHPTKTIENYLANVPDDQRIALENLRRAIKAAAPKAEECISYQIPTFRLNEKILVSFAAWKEHCAFYPGSHPIKVHKGALKSYDTDKGTIRFLVEHPLPSALVRQLVKTRVAQIRSQG